ncbi:MAG: hypothetical protein HXN43_02805 [Prevotella micans]|nr:hypothetical protein [Prevotella micans]
MWALNNALAKVSRCAQLIASMLIPSQAIGLRTTLHLMSFCIFGRQTTFHLMSHYDFRL